MILFKDSPIVGRSQPARVRERSARRRSPQPLHVISERLFHDALVRERKRADRFEEAFTVLLIAFDRERLTPAAVSHLAESLSQSPRGRGRDRVVRAGFGARSYPVDCRR